MKEERIIFRSPRKIALIGLAEMPPNKEKMPTIELSDNCEGWMVGYNPVEWNLQEKIEAILGPREGNECHPIVIKDVEGCEIELIVRYLP